MNQMNELIIFKSDDKIIISKTNIYSHLFEFLIIFLYVLMGFINYKFFKNSIIFEIVSVVVIMLYWLKAKVYGEHIVKNEKELLNKLKEFL